jgi:DNA-binding transcriptional MerR regulator
LENRNPDQDTNIASSFQGIGKTSDPAAPLYPLRVAAELSNTSVYALRQYVDLKLILPHKTKSNRRLYSQTDLTRIHCIRTYLDVYKLNIAGIKAMFAQVPCWLLKPCSADDQAQCDAYTAIAEPCWCASQKGPACRDQDCRLCSVYRLSENCQDLKTLFKRLTLADQPSNPIQEND